MTRIIKFRVWDKQFREWVDPDDALIHAKTGAAKGTKGGSGFCKEWELQQFIGITDDYGKDIYEGDITEDVITERFVVVWVNVDLCFTLVPLERFVEYRDTGTEDNLWREDLIDPGHLPLGTHKVIGNIYENPSLLKEVQDDR